MTPEMWQRIEDLFWEAKNRPKAERDAFIEAACGQEPGILEEVRGLLKESDTEGGLLGEPLLAVPRAAAEEMWDVCEEKIGAYRVVRPVGEGGMGAVFLCAREEGGFKQTVAIKLVRTGRYDQELIQRFMRERDILASLSHPNIAQLFDGGFTDLGNPYIVMEYIDGLPLDRYCDEKKLSIRQRIDLFREICDAVQFAHQNLIVHRDIKPGNILVTESGVPKLLDFGIAKLLEDSDATNRVETQTGGGFLSWRYAAPEQMAGENITTAVDQYALAVLLFELIVGDRPFESKTTDPRAHMKAVFERDAPLLSKRIKKMKRAEKMADSGEAAMFREILANRKTNAKRLFNQAKQDLDWVLHKALNREPRKRYASVERFSQDLKNFTVHLPVRARQRAFFYQMRRFMKRNALPVSGALTFFLLISGFIGVTMMQAKRIARKNIEVAQEKQRSDQIVEFLVTLFQSSDPFEEADSEIRAREVLDLGRERVKNDLVSQPVTQAKMFQVMGRVYGNLGLYDDAVDLKSRALEALSNAGITDTIEVASVQIALSQSLLKLGRLAPAEKLLNQALRICDDHPEETLKQKADAFIFFCDLRMQQDRFQESVSFAEACVSLWKQAGNEDSGELAQAYDILGRSLKAAGALAGAERSFLDAIRIQDSTPAQNDVKLGMMLNNLASLYLDAKRYSDAEPLLRRALGIWEQHLDAEHPMTATTLNNLGVLFSAQGKLDEAQLMHTRALAKRIARLGTGHAQSVESRQNLAAVAFRRYRFEEAAAQLKEVVSGLKAIHGPNHSSVANSLSSLGTCLVQLMRFEEAESILREALDISESIRGQDHPYSAGIMVSLGNLYRDQGAFDKSEKFFRKAIDIQSKAFGADNLNVGISQIAYGTLLLKMSRYEEARQIANESLQICRKSLPPGNITTSASELIYAKATMHLGQVENAHQMIEKIVTERSAQLGSDHWRTAEAQRILGECLGELGKFDEAIRVSEASYQVFVNAFGPQHPFSQRGKTALEELKRAAAIR